MKAIRYIVDDLTAACDFYRDLLDFEEELELSNGFASLKRGGIRLMLSVPGFGTSGRAGRAAQPGGWNRLQLRTNDLDGLVSRLILSGACICGEITESMAGRQAVVEDPAGNPVEIFQPTAA
ncbi:VOC family protein [Pseudoruegeria sp. HB172150]|uniref:VOC family protein n=1 Tax=Pseudoruegeria sp. HB172150 TaxID=2721164 RepID=UPI0015544017